MVLRTKSRNVVGILLVAALAATASAALWLAWLPGVARSRSDEFDRRPATALADEGVADVRPAPPQQESARADRKPASSLTPAPPEASSPTDEPTGEVADDPGVDREEALAILAKWPDIVDATHRRPSLLDPAILMHSDELNPRGSSLSTSELDAIAARVRGHRERYTNSLRQYESVANDELDLLIERGVAEPGPPGKAANERGGWQRQAFDPADPTKPLVYRAPGSAMPRTKSFHEAALAAWAMGWDVILVEFEKAGVLLPGESDSLRARVSTLVESVMSSYQR